MTEPGNKGEIHLAVMVASAWHYFVPGEMRGEAAPYSLVPSAESSLLQEKEGQGLQVIKEAANIITDKSRDKKRR